MRVVIIGGVAGGMSAAARLRRLDHEAEIVVLERSGHVSYANCGLPYYVGGVIEHERQLLLQTPASLNQRFRIDVRVHAEVIAIDAAARVVTVSERRTGTTYEVGYDALILSPGASPVLPPIPGIERAHVLRTVEDVSAIAGAVDQQPRRAVVIGGGFIGLEVAENLTHRGIPVTLVEATSQVLAPLDPELAVLVADELRRHHVDVRLEESVTAITPTTVELASGATVGADLVIAAIGVRPDVTLAKAAGLRIGARGGVVVDEVHRTSDPHIYAIGDVAEKVDALDGEATLVPLANVANRHGRVVADHLAGRVTRPVPTIGTAIVKVFGLTAAVTGWNEKRLVAAGRPVRALHIHPSHHAGYYPGAARLSLKLLMDPTDGTILGAQAVGTEGVDKRIDVIATALRAGLRAPELADLELAYAPPFGSAKDPVNLLGYVAENMLSGLTDVVQWHEVDDHRDRGYLLVDVRTPGEFARGSVPGAINVPVDDLRDRLDELDRRDVVVICQVGQRGHVATRLLRQRDFNAKNLSGGYQTWHTSPAARDAALVA